MNIKKYLRKRAEKDAEALITEEDKLFIQQLIKKTKKEKTKIIAPCGISARRIFYRLISD